MIPFKSNLKFVLSSTASDPKNMMYFGWMGACVVTFFRFPTLVDEQDHSTNLVNSKNAMTATCALKSW